MKAIRKLKETNLFLKNANICKLVGYYLRNTPPLFQPHKALLRRTIIFHLHCKSKTSGSD